MFNTRENIIALLAGAVTGLAAGLLLAPESVVRQSRGLAYRIREGGAEDVDLGSGTTAPLSEISEDVAKLEALRSRLEAGQP
jgi:gas vesicle protein